jgi:hypothetical protein
MLFTAICCLRNFFWKKKARSLSLPFTGGGWLRRLCLANPEFSEF